MSPLRNPEEGGDQPPNKQGRCGDSAVVDMEGVESPEEDQQEKDCMEIGGDDKEQEGPMQDADSTAADKE